MIPNEQSYTHDVLNFFKKMNLLKNKLSHKSIQLIEYFRFLFYVGVICSNDATVSGIFCSVVKFDFSWFCISP